MAGNAFTKQETVAFEQVLEGFNDQLVLSNLVNKYETDQVTMERSSDIIWRPVPYIVPSYNGLDQSANFNDKTQMSVPSTISFHKSVPFQLDAIQLRDMLQQNRLGEAAKVRLASDINVQVGTSVTALGSLVSKRTVAATGYDDVAILDAIMNEQGVPMDQRKALYGTRDFNNMAGNLASRQTVAGKVQTAYEKAFVDTIAGFDVYKGDYTQRLNAATATGVTLSAANQRYVPKATSTASTGETSNVDNRFQNLSVAVTGSTIKVGDAFTIAGVNSVHQITKGDTGQLKTFRVTAIISGSGGTGVIQITPPIVSADSSPTQAEIQYKNVTATPANGAVVTFLNTATAQMNPFWHKSCIELLPGRLAFPADAGMNVMTGTTDQGLQVAMVKQADIKTGNVFYRFDTRFGVAVLNTELCGIQLFSQT